MKPRTSLKPRSSGRLLDDSRTCPRERAIEVCATGLVEPLQVGEHTEPVDAFGLAGADVGLRNPLQMSFVGQRGLFIHWTTVFSRGVSIRTLSSNLSSVSRHLDSPASNDSAGKSIHTKASASGRVASQIRFMSSSTPYRA